MQSADDDLPAELMLEVVEKSLSTIPDARKPQARRETIAMFAGIFEKAGLPLPGWVRIGQERWGTP